MAEDRKEKFGVEKNVNCKEMGEHFNQLEENRLKKKEKGRGSYPRHSSQPKVKLMVKTPKSNKACAG